MAIEHKAFVFDYDAFIQELAGILNNALLTNDNKQLIMFIENNLSDLKHPDEGESLDSDWKEMIEIEDVSQYGDFAMTKYYNPNLNIGLGYDWEELDEYLSNELHPDVSLLLGVPFRPIETYFDPGKLGAYIQSPDLVNKNV